jgi:hypothetical protein
MISASPSLQPGLLQLFNMAPVMYGQHEGGVIVNEEDVLPVVAGLELITSILYPVPEVLLQGIVMLIVPVFAVELKVPIVIGEEKLPVELESTAE